MIVDSYISRVAMKNGQVAEISHLAPPPFASPSGFLQIVDKDGRIFSFNPSEIVEIISSPEESPMEEIEIPGDPK